MGTSWTFGTSWSFSGIPVRVMALVVTVVLAGALVAPPHQQTVAQVAVARMVATADQLVEVIVRQVVGTDEAERSVQRVGGTVVQRLGIIDGFVAKVPASRVGELGKAPGVLSVTANSRVRLLSRTMTGSALVGNEQLSFVRKVTGSDLETSRGYDGTGIGVALVDTGMASITGLSRAVRGPSVGGGTMEDGWGHGTHLAGIIAGNDGTTDGFLGIASDANLVSVKTAADDGSTSMISVLSALDWVAQYKDTKNIRVLNLSLGVPALTDYRYDVLAVAVERLWKAGIVVVVSAGNDGEKAGSPLTSPAYDPYVIAVGSADLHDTLPNKDDTVQSFSPRGSAARRVDLVAPGQSIVSLRAPGSYASNSYPAAWVGDRFIKGTGSSQAAAIVSGIAADLIESRPSVTPDQVKALLKAGATYLSATDLEGQGAGLVNLKKSISTNTPSNVTQTWDPAGVYPTTAPLPAAPPPPDSNYCSYDVTLNGPPSPTTCGWSGGSWSSDGSTFTGGSWTGGSWTGGSWTGGSWTGGSWTGGSWTGGSWTVGTWTGGSWTGGSWTGGSWTGGSWTGGSWTGGSWTGGSWTGGSWTGTSWS